MNNPLGVRPSKGTREPQEVKKKSFDLGGNRTHDLRIFLLYFIYLFHLRSYLQCSLTNTYTHNTQWTSLQKRSILSFTVKTTRCYIIIALVCNVLAPFLKMDGQLIDRFHCHAIKKKSKKAKKLRCYRR